MSNSPRPDRDVAVSPSAHHVGVTVADLDRAVSFYTNTFGFEVLTEFTVGGDAFSEGVGVPDASGRFAHLNADGIRLELIAYDPEGESLPAATLNRPGAVHLGFAVDDLDAFHATLDPSVETISEPQTTESGTTILFIRDPEGNLVEVVETG